MIMDSMWQWWSDLKLGLRLRFRIMLRFWLEWSLRFRMTNIMRISSGIAHDIGLDWG